MAKHRYVPYSRAEIGRRLRRIEWRPYVVYIAFVIIFLVFAMTQYGNGFLSSYNLLNIVSQTTTISVMAVGMTFVIAAAEIDLSVGNAAGLASVTTALTIQSYGVFLGILAGLCTGLRSADQWRTGDTHRHPLIPRDPGHDGRDAGHWHVDHQYRARANPE